MEIESEEQIEKAIDELLKVSSDGCCRDESWRGHSCTYHEGFLDGMYALLDRMMTDRFLRAVGGE